LGIVVLLVVFGIPAYVIYEIYDWYEQKNTTFPAKSISQPGQPYTQWEKFTAVKAYLDTNARKNVDREYFLSDPSLLSNPCPVSDNGVRAIIKVVDPANGNTSDSTLLFCVDPTNGVVPSNPEARYFTKAE
jgi:hypothetical protein